MALNKAALAPMEIPQGELVMVWDSAVGGDFTILFPKNSLPTLLYKDAVEDGRVLRAGSEFSFMKGEPPAKYYILCVDEGGGHLQYVVESNAQRQERLCAGKEEEAKIRELGYNTIEVADASRLIGAGNMLRSLEWIHEEFRRMVSGLNGEASSPTSTARFVFRMFFASMDKTRMTESEWSDALRALGIEPPKDKVLKTLLGARTWFNRIGLPGEQKRGSSPPVTSNGHIDSEAVAGVGSAE